MKGLFQMKPETSGNTPIIPLPGISVKCAMASLLAGLPLQSREYGVTLDSGISSNEFGVTISRLSGAERQAVVLSRFKQGDAWNQFQHSEHSAARMAWIASLKATLPETVVHRLLRNLRNYGWVANKWPESQRSDKKGWTFYVENAHGVPVKKSKPEGLPYYVAIRRVVTEDGDWLECAGSGDKRIMVRVPSTLQTNPEHAEPILQQP
jgi:hypothetical protein